MRNKTANQILMVKRVIKMLFEFYPKLLPIILILTIANAVLASLPAIFQQNIVSVLQQAWDNGRTWEATKPLVMQVVYGLLFVYALALIINFTNQQLMAIFTQGSLDKMRKKIFNHMEHLPIRFFDQNQRGDIMSYYTNDIEAMRQMISQSLPQLLVSAISLVTILAIMLYYSIPLALVILLGAFVSVSVTSKVGGLSAKYFVAQQKMTGQTEGVIEEMINGLKVIKVFNHEQEAQEAFDKANNELFEASHIANRYANTLMPILNNINYIVYALVAVMSGIFIETKFPNFSISGLGFSIAVAVPFLQMSRQFAGAIQQISPQINAMVMGLAGAQRVFSLLDEEVEEDEGSYELVNTREENGVLVESSEKTKQWAWKVEHNGVTELLALKGDVKFKNVDFSYSPDKQILYDLSLYAKPGQKVAFVGATGAGKTTITNLINRFYDIEKGQILYDGLDIKKIKKSSLRKSLGIVLQDTVLFTATVMENIRYGNLDATDAECIQAAKLAGAHEFIKHLPQGYQTVLHGGASNLSQGQTQLLAIARAAVNNPPVMILDEATSSIDTRTEQIVQTGMDNLMEGRTVFVIAHRLSTVKNSNVIIVLDHGHIIERGTHQELLNQKGQYYQLYTGAFELE
ncbi:MULTISPECIES: ABC transporter ATP-binding protein [Terrabacteria group]|uniref:ABC transporter ATP-binding protein n=1 Tax=Bacillati TaxID=1783272 RepID=UPI001C6F21CE|nr:MULTISPECIES: ABC transporter ATP-binding protein [Terrabacteria group]MBW9212903.1 ABC transporter ATP-binding protein/permease [Trueperella sp. zg.1013]